MLEFTTKFMTRDLKSELRGMSDAEVARAITGASRRISAEFELFREKTEAGLLVPTGTLAESVTTHYMTSAAEAPALTLEHLKEMYERVRRSTEFKLGGVTVNIADYDVHDFGDIVVMWRDHKNLYLPHKMEAYDLIIVDRERRRVHVFKAPKADGYSPVWPFEPVQYLKFPKQRPDEGYLWDSRLQMRFTVPAGPGLVVPFWDPPWVEREPSPRWEEYICLTDAEFFEVYDEVEVPS